MEIEMKKDVYKLPNKTCATLKYFSQNITKQYLSLLECIMSKNKGKDNGTSKLYN